MRLPPLTLLPLACLAAASGARDAPVTVASATAGLVPGTPLTCLPNRLQTSLRSDGAALIYRVSRSLVYVSRTNGGCERVARGDALVTVSRQGALCSGDIAQTVDRLSRMPTGGCALGDFVPYRKPGA